jgi:hypothetical protein
MVSKLRRQWTGFGKDKSSWATWATWPKWVTCSNKYRLLDLRYVGSTRATLAHCLRTDKFGAVPRSDQGPHA